MRLNQRIPDTAMIRAVALGLSIFFHTGVAEAFPQPAREGEDAELDDSAADEHPGSLTAPSESKPAGNSDEGSASPGNLLAPRKKSFRWMQEPQIWSMGARAGMWGNTGFLGQYIGEGTYAWNLGVSFLDMQGGPDTTLSLEMLWLYGPDWKRLITPNKGKWQSSRGKLVYYHGAGVQILSEGAYLRIPVGVQQTLLEYPLTWSVQLTLLTGQLMGNRPGFAPLVAPEISVRYLLGGS